MIRRCLSSKGYVVDSQRQKIDRLKFASNYEEIEKGWSKNHRGDIRRQTKRLKSQGNLDLFSTKNSQEIVDKIQVLFKLHKEEWSKKGHTSEFADDSICCVYLDFVRKLPSQFLYYSELCLDEKVLSCHFGFIGISRPLI